MVFESAASVNGHIVVRVEQWNVIRAVEKIGL